MKQFIVTITKTGEVTVKDAVTGQCGHSVAEAIAEALGETTTDKDTSYDIAEVTIDAYAGRTA